MFLWQYIVFLIYFHAYFSVGILWENMSIKKNKKKQNYPNWICNCAWQEIWTLSKFQGCLHWARAHSQRGPPDLRAGERANRGWRAVKLDGVSVGTVTLWPQHEQDCVVQSGTCCYYKLHFCKTHCNIQSKVFLFVQQCF